MIRHLEKNCEKSDKYECNICNQKFTNKINFNLHKLKCNYMCKKCNKKFEYAILLDKHKTTCTGATNNLIFYNSTINNFNNTCTSCKLPCEKMFCEKCIYISSNIPTKCQYCDSIIQPCDMFNHIQESHKNKIISM